ncbi:MAG TPA: NUDIX hydrolase [Solirubrobacterales bacterium]|nr:NUDIX hydrolase [Solirubrobacterales bacterium]
MERISSKRVYDGQISDVRIDTFRRADGEEAEREIVGHPGAVGVVAHDDEKVFLVRQPREAVGEDDLLELPAGKLDVEGEEPIDCAKRELEEETGLRAGTWRELKRFFTTPGWSDEEVILFEATDLERSEPDPDEGEQIELVEASLDDLADLIADCRDAKSLIGLLTLRARRP